MELLEWDAKSYDALPLPHRRWGATAIAQLELGGSETVVDIGAGTGRDAERLLDELPRGHVVAVDGSAQMLAELRDRLSSRLDQVTVLQADLRQPLELARPADAALSVATLHWLPDHETIFRTVSGALRPGGRFVAEAGGAGNIAGFRRALRDVSGDDGAAMWNFAGIEETRDQLTAAGFVDVEVRLIDDPARLERGEQLDAYIATVMIAAVLRDLAPEQRRPLVRAVADALPEPVIDYVRLQIEAVRGKTVTSS